jgi:hypothetical protein
MNFYFSVLYLWLMGQTHNANWIITFLVTTIFAVPISSIDASGDLLHSALFLAFAFYAC